MLWLQMPIVPSIKIAKKCISLKICIWVVMVYTFNPSTPEAEAEESLNLRPALSTEQVPAQPGLHREILSQKQNKKSDGNE